MNLRGFLPLRPYLITVAVVTVIVSIKLVMNEWLDMDSSFLMLLCAVAICSVWGGKIQGTIAAVLSATAVTAYHVATHDISSGQLDFADEVARFIMFGLDSALVIFVCDQLRKALTFKRQTEGKFRTIFESNIIGFLVCDHKGNVFDANDCYLRMLGLSREDFLSRNINWRDYTPPEHLNVSDVALEQIKKTGVATPFEKVYIRTDGKRIAVLVGATSSDNLLVAYVLDISARKEAERELAEAKNRLEENVNVRTKELLEANRELSETQHFLDSVIENIPNMIFVKDAKDLRFVRLNRAGEQLLGYNRLDLLGKNDYDFFAVDQADFFTSKDRDVLKGNSVVDIPEEPITTRTGDRALHTKKIPILGKDGTAQYLLGISEDITEKKAAEKQRIELAQVQAAKAAAERSNRRLSFLSEASAALNESLDIRSLLNGFSRVIVKHMAHWCIIDLYDEQEGTIDRMTTVARVGEIPAEIKEWWKDRRFDINSTEGIGFVIRTGQSRVYNDLTSERMAELFNKPYLLKKNQEWNINSSMVVPLAYHGKVLGTISFVNTIPKQNFDEFDLSIAQDLAKRAALAIENASLYSKASEASRAKSSFLANISHEIRTPLGAMLGFAELVLDEHDLSPKQQAYIATIARNGRQLLRLVDEILDLSKVESERIQIEQLSFALPPLIKEAHALMRVKADEKGLNLVSHGMSELPDRVKSDPLRIRQILLNVIGNAIKFTEKGQIVVQASFKSDSDSEHGILQIRVHDTGIGMDEDQSSRIFQPFVQADGTMTRKYGGTGLGLFLARKLARLMGGDVILEKSSPGRGSDFLITLAVEVDTSIVTAQDKKRTADVKVGARNPHLKVLLVDDSPDNRMLISAFLASPDIDLDLAENGSIGVEKALKGHYDLVLMDIQMPEMDGYEAVRLLGDRGYKGPIVALTAHAMKGDRERCLKAGFDDYLCKPITRKALLELLARYAPPSQTQVQAH